MPLQQPQLLQSSSQVTLIYITVSANARFMDSVVVIAKAACPEGAT